MLKWLKNFVHALYHAVAQPTIGEYLIHRADLASKELADAKAKAEATFKRDMLAVETVAHQELDSLERAVARAQTRVSTLLESGIDLGERNVDAAMLHLNLTKAVK